MPALFTYLFKVNIALVLFCLGYYVVLRHLTFYTLNRVYLVGAILFASIYPFINVNSFVQRHQQLTAPVQTIILNWKAPAENLVKPLDRPDYWQWAEMVFWAGALLLAIRLMMQLFSLYRLYKNSEPGQVHQYPVRIIDGDVSPFSFWRSIFVNPEKLSPSDLEKVLEHEHVHVSQWHTLDILLAELSTIFYWFNPGIWLMKKAVRENIEFITDRKILQKGTDSKQYQYSLLSVSMAGIPNNLVNNFNISTIKKRIIMMNAKRSSRYNLTRYLFVAPAVIILLLAVSISKAEIAKKGIITLKSLTAAIKNVTITNDDRPIIHPVSRPEKATTVVKVKPKKHTTTAADTIYAAKSKDGKRNILMTSDLSLDSIGYVINGAKATRADLNNLDPAKVMSLDMVSAKDAKQLVDFQLNKSDILFVTTDDSETGKKLKARMDKIIGNPAMLSLKKARSAGSSANMDVSPGASYSITGSGSESKDIAPAAAGTAYSLSTSTASDMAPEAAVAQAKVMALTSVRTASATKVNVSGDGVVSVNSDDAISPEVVTTLKLTKVIPVVVSSKNMVYLTKVRTGDDETNRPIIVVDGKEIKNLKKVSPNDIKSVVVLTDKDATSKYGDKGKNGVIVITTKKGN